LSPWRKDGDDRTDRAEDSRERRRLARQFRDVGSDAVDLVADIFGIGAAAIDTAEDALESAVGRVFGRRGEKIWERIEEEIDEERRKPRRSRQPPRPGRPGNPNRPGKQVGHSRGDLDGSPLTDGDLEKHHDPSSWAGERKRAHLAFLFMRANPGDTGTRPVVGPFWESPDIYILPGVHPSMAPDTPPSFGGVALANADNTVYAHVWNFGHAAASNVIVEFYWCNPALGINAGSAIRIGEAWLSLGARGSGNAHAVVKCPEPWSATYLNGGHECLLVRAWDLPHDLLGKPEWDASLNRHIGQRNIHVATAAEMAGQGVTLHVGPLFGEPAAVRVERADPTAMPWLQLRAGRGQFPTRAMPTGAVLLSPPGAIGGAPGTGAAADEQHVHTDGQQVKLTTTDDPPGAGEAHVYRVTANQGGQAFGGYSVVILGE
jgi:hypothetical protein